MYNNQNFAKGFAEVFLHSQKTLQSTIADALLYSLLRELDYPGTSWQTFCKNLLVLDNVSLKV
jgi:hypothetical protein